MWAQLRQLAFPREFRITLPGEPPDLLLAIERLVKALPGSVTTVPDRKESGLGASEARLLSDVGTSLWRLRRRMTDPGTGEPLEEMRLAYRHLESAWDALLQAGVEVVDHTNTLFDPGMSLQVVAFQPSPGINHAMVIETIKPSIYFHDQCIQTADVIVGTPQQTGDSQDERVANQ